MYIYPIYVDTILPSVIVHSTNISGTSIFDGMEVCPYLPPVPPQGSGYHRYVFAVYSHKEPLPSDLLPVTDKL